VPVAYAFVIFICIVAALAVGLFPSMVVGLM